MNITTSTQFEEWKKCKDDAKYFIEKYIKLPSPTGDVPFILSLYQDDTLTRLILGHKKCEKSDPSTDLFKIVNQYTFEHNDSKTREAIVEDVQHYIMRNITVRDKTKQKDIILGKVVLGVDVLNISWDITL